MPVAQPPQRIQIGSRFPAWDTEESCFELAFRREAGGPRWASFQQQLVIWDVWVAIGFKRARQFEEEMLEGGLIVEGYPAQGVLDNSLSPDSDPLAHPLAAVSPLTKPVSDAAVPLGSQRAQEKAERKSKSGKGEKGKTGASNKANGGAANMKKDQRSETTPVMPKKVARVLVNTAGKPSQAFPSAAPAPLVFVMEAGLAPPEHAPAPVVSPSPSNHPSSGVSSSKRSSASTDSPATKKPKLKSASAEIKEKVKAEEDEVRVVSFKAHPSPAVPSTPQSAPDPAFLAYLSSLDVGGAVDYSIFASDLAHLGIKNHKALERVAATAENRKRLVKDLAKLRSTDKYALIIFEEDLKAKVAGGKDG